MSGDHNQHQKDCYGDGNVYRGQRSKDTETKTFHYKATENEMTNDIKECGTCGYPLLPEEREGLMEVRGKMLKPWLTLTDDELNELARWADEHGGTFHIAYARAVMAKLHEKNHEKILHQDLCGND